MLLIIIVCKLSFPGRIPKNCESVDSDLCDSNSINEIGGSAIGRTIFSTFEKCCLNLYSINNLHHDLFN